MTTQQIAASDERLIERIEDIAWRLGVLTQDARIEGYRPDASDLQTLAAELATVAKGGAQ